MGGVVLPKGQPGDFGAPEDAQMAVGQNQWHHSGVGEFTTHFRLPILVVGLVDVHWGYDLAFVPWPCCNRRKMQNR